MTSGPAQTTGAIRTTPPVPFLYTVSLMHCMPSGLSDNGAGLGMMWGRETALTMLAEAGFDSVKAGEMANDPFITSISCAKSPDR